MLKSAGKEFERKPKRNRNLQPKWFDDSCYTSKRLKYKLLRQYRQHKTEQSLQRYISARNEFKNMCKINKNRSGLIKIYENLLKSKSWWKSMKMNENQWKLTKMYENKWNSNKCNGIWWNEWKSLQINENLWNHWKSM